MLSIFLLLFGVANASSSNCVAIDSSSDSYVCTDSPIVSLTEKFDTGVPQRISGSPAEQQRIIEVMTKMQNYYEGEILSRSEYAHVRKNCRNNHDLCAFWTSVGECETNRIFMQDNCAAACRLCLLANTHFDQVIHYH